LDFEPYTGGLDRSVDLIMEILGSPPWARRGTKPWTLGSELDVLFLDIHKDFRIEIGLSGPGGSAGWRTSDNQSETVLHQGFPFYDMSPELQEDLSFVIQICLDLTNHMAEQRALAIDAGNKELSVLFEGILKRLIVFIGVSLTERPELIQEPYRAAAIEYLNRDWFS
jgi:hypothetical protein